MSRIIHAGKARDILIERFPLCFAARGLPKRPLKIGIRFDIKTAAPEIKTRTIHIGLFDYCQGPRYLESFVTGVQRIGIDGADAGAVTDGDVVTAQLRAAGIRHDNAVYKALRDAGVSVAAIEAGVVKDMLEALNDAQAALFDYPVALRKGYVLRAKKSIVAAIAKATGTQLTHDQPQEKNR